MRGSSESWTASVLGSSSSVLQESSASTRNVGGGDLEVGLDTVVDRLLDVVGLEVEGEPAGGLLGVVVDEDGGTVPSAVGLVVVVSDEMPDELMVSDIQTFGFIKFGWGRFTNFGQSHLFYLVNFEFGGMQKMYGIFGLFACTNS